MSQQDRTCGHVIRADCQDPMRQMTIDAALLMPGIFTRRVGRPRKVVRERRIVFRKKKNGEEYDHTDEERRLWVKIRHRKTFLIYVDC